MDFLLLIIPVICILALVYTWFVSNRINRYDAGNDRMKQIAQYIQNGAMSFLKAEYKILAIFVVIVGILLAATADPHRSHWMIVLGFVLGAFLSALAGFIGMRVATKANVRTTNAARTSLSKAMDISFSGGAVMGISVAALGILGLTILFIFLQRTFNAEAELGEPLKRVLEILTGFSLGAESIALFARVGGGIYTKAADVGADLVGKVEAGIPEDDPRNPAVIADNVGDNVGDVAGMGADLFGSYVSTVLATMVLGATVTYASGVTDQFGGLAAVLLPLVIVTAGMIFSIVGTWFVRIGENGDPQAALNRGNFIAIILSAVASYFAIKYMLPENFLIHGQAYTSMNIFWTVVAGLAVGTLMSLITEYYCAMGRGPVETIARQSISGGATNIIAGLSVGMISTALPIIVLVAGIVTSYALGGVYGVAIAATGMMATTAIQLAIDAFGPIADNAGGIAEMSALPKEVREKTDILDTVGNTTAAIGKGFAIASAALTSLALFAAFKEITGIQAIDISQAHILGGLFLGGMVPFLFSALAMRAVGQAANAMVVEVRRQFKEIEGLLEGKEGVEPDYDRCIQISTTSALRLMLLPGLLAILTPIIVGFGFNMLNFNGAEVLAAVLAGIAVSGVLMALFQSNAGGAWDNAKKSFEKGVKIDGNTYFKGSDPHKAAVTGDTVGDPFKDTSGPSMNILIKLTAIVALIIAPLLTKYAPKSSVSSHAAPTTEQAAATATTNAAVPLKTLSQDLTSVTKDLKFDVEHSFIGFSVKHIISRATGSVKPQSGLINLNGDLSKSAVAFDIDMRTIMTQNTKRDAHLMGEDFFDTKKYPTASFVSTSIEKSTKADFSYVAKGTLNLHGVSKPVELYFNYLGSQKIEDGEVYSFSGETTILQSDFGMDPGTLGNDVQITFNIEAN